MSPSRAVRLAAASVLGVAAGATLWVRAAPIEPFLDIKVTRQLHSPNYDMWGVTVRSRGGEGLDEVRIEPVKGEIHMVGPAVFRSLPAGWATGFRIQVEGEDRRRAEVRVVQVGRVERSYAVTLDDEP